MQVSFIIPLFNCLALTRDCVQSLLASLPQGLQFEIILVDDGSTDGTRDWLATLTAPFQVVLNERNLGYAGANNRGAALAGGEVLFFLNNDLVLAPGWFEPMFALVRRKPRAGLVGNVQVAVATGRLDHCGVDFEPTGKPVHLTRRPRWAQLVGHRRVVALTGACFAVTRERWRQLGGFDAEFVNGCEDIDLALKALATGCTNYVSLRSVVGHHISQSPGRKLRDEQNTRRLLRRWREEITGHASRRFSREWCGRFIAAHWEQSSIFDHALGRHALGHWLGVAPSPRAAVRRCVQTAIDGEFARWTELLGSERQNPDAATDDGPGAT